MQPILTTICPYWGRPESLRVYLKALAGASIPEVKHVIFFVGGGSGSWELPSHQFEFIDVPKEGHSIGYYHNQGARIARTEWIMKSDVDILPHVWYFKTLLPILMAAKPGEWFNGGFIYIRKHTSDAMLTEENMPLLPDLFAHIVRKRDVYSQHTYAEPAGSQFICRRQDYLRLGGCCGFRGWGWEDYQQLYMLERHRIGQDPIPGELNIHNVTQRCRDEISRPKAMELFQRNELLCLLHKWHPETSGTFYKEHKERNRQTLLDYILDSRKGSIPCPM